MLKNKLPKVIIIVIISLSFVFLLSKMFVFNKNDSQKEVKTRFAIVKKGNIINSVSTTGKITANLEIDIKCKASGEILSLPLDISDTVKKGQLILKLDPVDEQQIVKQSEMTLLQSKSSLAKAKQELLSTKLNLENNKKTATDNLRLAKIKLLDQKKQTQFIKSKYLNQLETNQSNLKSAKINQEDLLNKLNSSQNLYKKGYISKNEYDASNLSYQQSLINYENLKTKELSDKINYQNELNNNQSTIEQVKIDIDILETKLKEQKQSESNLILKQEDIKSLEARLESDKSSLLNAQQRLKDTQVYSPINGVITNRSVQEGQIISSGISNVAEGTTVMTVSDLSRLFIVASVDESDIGKIKLDQDTEITVDAFPNKVFKGKVVQIYSKGENVSNVVTFPVKIEILGENKNGKKNIDFREILKPEMTANIDIFTSRKDDVLTIPKTAVIKKNMVEILTDEDKPLPIEVKLGLSDYENIEVKNNLTEGQKVILNETENSTIWKKDPNKSKSNEMRRMIMRNSRGK